MRLLLASVILAAPAFAMQAPATAQEPIPERTLRNQQQACVSECQKDRQQAYCTEVCSCVTDELRQHFTAAEFKARTARLSENAEDPDVNREMEQIAAYCAQRMGQ